MNIKSQNTKHDIYVASSLTAFAFNDLYNKLITMLLQRD